MIQDLTVTLYLSLTLLCLVAGLSVALGAL